MKDKIKGGLWGLLIGDALGVPYEFKDARDIPSYAEIEMIPPAGYDRTYKDILPGTWSDDGAQALCLLDSLLSCGGLDLDDFASRMLSWYNDGSYAVANHVFDVGVQTAQSLTAFSQGMPPEKSGSIIPDGKGNGALMRVLPLVLWAEMTGLTERELFLAAHRQCLPTHGHPVNQVCCALYCLVSRGLLHGQPFKQAYRMAVEVLREEYELLPEDYTRELEFAFRPGQPMEGTGSGFVIDSLRSVFMILERAESYEDAVKQAVALGKDTDTTACITGGAAGIVFGYDSIPGRWLAVLREKEYVESFEKKLLGAN